MSGEIWVNIALVLYSFVCMLMGTCVCRLLHSVSVLMGSCACGDFCTVCECAYGYVYMGDSCLVCVRACGCMYVYVCGLIHSVCGDSATMYECVYGCIYGGTQAQCMCLWVHVYVWGTHAQCVCLWVHACEGTQAQCVSELMGACVCVWTLAQCECVEARS